MIKAVFVRFFGRCASCFEKDGYVVKAEGQRRTLVGTAWYQLNHASLWVGVKRLHIVCWFGCCSYRKEKVVVEKEVELCPICQHELVNLSYYGSRLGVLSKDLADCKAGDRRFFDSLIEEDREVWVECFGRDYRGS